MLAHSVHLSKNISMFAFSWLVLGLQGIKVYAKSHARLFNSTPQDFSVAYSNTRRHQHSVFLCVNCFGQREMHTILSKSQIGPSKSSTLLA